ncbi:branched-chain amino acid ABC transporter permease [Acidovorax sp. JHL-9]|uniref:branched-chain amino acid ABC transporter permease n=1 Tax=Acidovorax sp. JHL-9 TaxID=1276756 RepID=UPI000479DB0E|nr:branched-chain amino acid ABC transporter permease [Acidovorax sp. JHL-9]
MRASQSVATTDGSTRTREWAIALLALAILAVIPLLSSSRALQDFIIRLAAFGILATSLNMLIGYGGMVSFGHAMFFGGGAYTFALLMQKAGVSVPSAIAGTVLLTAVVGALVGAICVRLKEIYFAFLTLAFQMFVHRIILSWVDMTGGDQGITGGIPRPVFLGINLANFRELYWFACFLGVACLLLIRWILQSPFGYSLRMVRDNADRAWFLGINVWRIRLYAFVLSSCFASIGGVIMALFVSGAFPEFSYWTMSGEAIFMIMMGGLHMYLGPLVGAGLLLLFNDVITRVTESHGLVLGVIVLIFALGFKRGILDFVLQLSRRFKRVKA